jgi:hypothetical protein
VACIGDSRQKLIQFRIRREELKVETEDVHSRDEQARAKLEKLGHRHIQEQDRLRAIERMYQLFTADYRALTDGVETVGRLALTAPMRVELDEIDAFAREASSRKIADMDKAEMEVRSQTIKELIRELGKRKREQDEEDVESGYASRDGDIAKTQNPITSLRFSKALYHRAKVAEFYREVESDLTSASIISAIASRLQEVVHVKAIEAPTIPLLLDKNAWNIIGSLVAFRRKWVEVHMLSTHAYLLRKNMFPRVIAIAKQIWRARWKTYRLSMSSTKRSYMGHTIALRWSAQLQCRFPASVIFRVTTWTIGSSTTMTTRPHFL